MYCVCQVVKTPTVISNSPVLRHILACAPPSDSHIQEHRKFKIT